jgi:hypothetical protein
MVETLMWFRTTSIKLSENLGQTTIAMKEPNAEQGMRPN